MKHILKILHFTLIILVTSLITTQQVIESSRNSSVTNEVVSRRKRFIIFPKGSSLQVVYCFLTTAYGTPGGLFTIGITLGLAWEIPHDPRPYFRNATMSLLHRRHRRDLFPKIETFLDKYGVKGRACILRAICESKEHQSGNGTFMEEIFHSLFSLPPMDEIAEDFTSIYDEAHHTSCVHYRTACPTSILDLDITGASDPRKYSRDDT